MKYLYLLFAIFFVGCTEIRYIGTECKIQANDTNYTNELMMKSKEIRETVLATYSQKGTPQARYENEDMDDEIKAMSDLIESQIRQTDRILTMKYCKEVDKFWNVERHQEIFLVDVKDTMQLRILNQIKLQTIKEME